MTAPDAAEVEALRQKHARDLNCLIDEDRSTRRRSLTKLKKALVEQPTASEATRAEFFAVHAQSALINLFADPVEKCREFAIAIVTAFASMAPLVRLSLSSRAALLPGGLRHVARVDPSDSVHQARSLLLRRGRRALAAEAPRPDRRARGAARGVGGAAADGAGPGLAEPAPAAERARVPTPEARGRTRGSGEVREDGACEVRRGRWERLPAKATDKHVAGESEGGPLCPGC